MKKDIFVRVEVIGKTYSKDRSSAAENVPPVAGLEGTASAVHFSPGTMAKLLSKNVSSQAQPSFPGLVVHRGRARSKHSVFFGCSWWDMR